MPGPRTPSLVAAALAILGFGLSALTGCKGASGPASAPSGPKASGSPRPGGARAPSAFPVQAEEARATRLEQSLSAVGQLEAFEQIQVTATVAGAVERVLFQEGDAVKAGQSLVSIELERFRLEVEAAKAALARAEAQRAEADAALKRREAAEGSGLFSAEEVEGVKTRARGLAAAVAEARVALQQAELDLRAARVPAPSSGIIQSRTVQTGQYVKEGDVLATLVQRDPLLLRFSVPEPDAARLHAGMVARFHVRSLDEEHEARIVHVAAEADAAARMVAVTAHVTDDAAGLRPGAFAEVVVPVGANEDAVVVPDTAIRPSERGFLVFVIEGETARERVVELGLRTAEGGVEIRSGVAAGERVAVRGAEALREGATVRVVSGEEADRTAGAAERGGS